MTGGTNAVSEFDAGYYSAAFPEIFLDGKCELYADREIALSESEWLEHLMWVGDNRAARHKVGLFDLMYRVYSMKHSAARRPRRTQYSIKYTWRLTSERANQPTTHV